MNVRVYIFFPGNTVVIYRVNNFVDISRGPMIPSTSYMGRCTISAVHPIETELGSMYRVQGVALPKGIMLNHFSYGILEERARQLNSGRYPGIIENTNKLRQAV